MAAVRGRTLVLSQPACYAKAAAPAPEPATPSGPRSPPGIIVSLAANIATAPSMSWAPILVAGWPPVALLLAVELLGHRRSRGGGDRDRADDPTRELARDGENRDANA